MSGLDELYQRIILEHHQRPRNTGRLASPTHGAELRNPLCGDRLTLTLEVSEGVLRAARCDVRGCALCRASGSLLTEAVTGRSSEYVERLVDQFLLAVAGAHPTSGPETETLASLAPLTHVRHFRGRTRCVTLPWEALRRALAARAPELPA